MPRKNRGNLERAVLSDPVFNSVLVSKFINRLMLDGKKSTAARIFYGSLDLIAKKTGEDPLKVFKKAVDSVKPQVEVKSRRVGGATYQVPVEVNPKRQLTLSLRWIVSAAKSRGERTMVERLAGEFMDAVAGKGTSMKKREDVYRMAEANRAFAHYRW